MILSECFGKILTLKNTEYTSQNTSKLIWIQLVSGKITIVKK